MKLKLLSALTVAAGFAASTNASAIAVGDLSALPNYTFGSPQASSFDDIFTFSLTGGLNAFAGSAQIDYTSATNPMKTFTAVLTGPGSFTDTWSTLTGPHLILKYSDTSPLASGAYTLEIAGTTLPGAGKQAFTLNLQASPVPEPETYSMLMAGLGLLGFIARRRTKG